MTKEILIKLLKDYRIDNNLNQTQMAKLLKCKQQNISRFEKGDIDPGLKWVSNLLNVIGYKMIIKPKGGKR